MKKIKEIEEYIENKTKKYFQPYAQSYIRDIIANFDHEFSLIDV
jgi:hypothetical protein